MSEAFCFHELLTTRFLLLYLQFVNRRDYINLTVLMQTVEMKSKSFLYTIIITMKQQWLPQELIDHWTLTNEEITLVNPLQKST